MAKITAIEPHKRDPNRVHIYLDGNYAFDLSGILAAWLRVGTDLSADRISSLQADEVGEQAYQRALDFLSYRPRSEAEIRQYLQRRKVPETVLHQTLERLRSRRLADDGRFAQAWVENRSAFRPRGRRSLEWELHQKGVAPEAAQSALKDLDEADLAHRAGLKKAAHLGGAQWAEFRTKLTSFLARRGFPYAVIASAVNRLWGETRTGDNTSDNEDIP
jgi:regulatory protein